MPEEKNPMKIWLRTKVTKYSTLKTPKLINWVIRPECTLYTMHYALHMQLTSSDENFLVQCFSCRARYFIWWERFRSSSSSGSCSCSTQNYLCYNKSLKFLLAVATIMIICVLLSLLSLTILATENWKHIIFLYSLILPI